MARVKLPWLDTFSVSQKLFFILGFTTLAFFIAGLVGFIQMQYGARTWEELDQQVTIKQDLLQEIQSSIGYGHGIHDFKNLVLRRDLSRLPLALSNFEHALEKIDEFLNLPFVTDDEIAQLYDLKGTLSAYLNHSYTAGQMIQSGATAEEIDLRVKFDDILAVQALDALDTSITQLAKEKRALFSNLMFSIPQSLAVAWILSLIISMLIVFAVNRSISSSIKVVSRQAERIAQGDLTKSLPYAGSVEIRNLTESLEKMRASLVQTISNLENSNKDLEQYAYVVSHDLQEPLRKILAFGSKLEKSAGENLNEEARFSLSRVLDSSRRMRTLIDDLLTYSRVSQKEQRQQEVDLNKIITSVWADLEILVKEKKAVLQTVPLPPVIADPIQMRQLFQNLIHNSLKFSRPGAAPVVKIEAAKNGFPSNVQITVSDNGIGFEQKYADRILLPFQRLHARNEYPGTGIGLAICNKIVHRHGSRLEVQSQINTGSKFIFNLREVL